MILNEIKKKLNIEISDELLIYVLFEMNRYFDKTFILEIKKLQKELNIILNSIERKELRKHYYYGKFIKNHSKYKINQIIYTKEDLNFVLNDVYKRLQTYDETKIIKSIEERVLTLNQPNNKYNNNWLKEYEILNKEYKYSLLELRVNQELFKENNYNCQFIFDFIAKTYKTLENYRHFIFVVDGELYDKNNNCITWNVISEVSIYAENFIKFSDNLLQFHKDKKLKN